jgi:hypothetical protein
MSTSRCLRDRLKKYGRARSAEGAVYDLSATWQHADAILLPGRSMHLFERTSVFPLRTRFETSFR